MRLLVLYNVNDPDSIECLDILGKIAELQELTTLINVNSQESKSIISNSTNVSVQTIPCILVVKDDGGVIIYESLDKIVSFLADIKKSFENKSMEKLKNGKTKLSDLGLNLTQQKPKDTQSLPSRKPISNDTYRTSSKPPVSTNGYVDDDEDTVEFIPKPDKKARPSLEEMQKEREQSDAEMLIEIKKNAAS